MAAPGRCELLGGIVLLAGLLLFFRAVWNLSVQFRAKFTDGAPYRRGLVADRLLGLLMTMPIAPLGAALVAVGLAQAGFQPTSTVQPTRVGRIEARRTGWGKTSVQLAPDPLYPEKRLLEGEIAGSRWAVAGEFVDWSPGIRWLGLHPAHRVSVLIGSVDPGGLSTGDARPVVPIDAPPRATALLLRYKRFVPFLTVRQKTSAWFEPAEKQIVILYATVDGYVADSVAERGRSR